MKIFGERLKNLRTALNMTESELAAKLGITPQTVVRYENGETRGNMEVLLKVSRFFDVSTDYMLGLSGPENEHLNGTHYVQYINCRENYVIDADAEYYWIFSEREKFGGQTEFIEWYDESEKLEKRRLCIIPVEETIQICKEQFGTPMVINSKEDVDAFLEFGGWAIVKKSVCEEYLQEYMEDFIMDSYGDPKEKKICVRALTI